MAKYTGKDGKVTTDTDAVVNLRGFTLEETSDELDASIIDGSNDYSCEGGQQKRSGTIEVLYDPADAGAVNLVDGAKVALELFPIGDATGKIKKSGNAFIGSVSTPVENNGMVTQSFSFTVDGAWATDTIV